jgi:uncharacterized protein YciI
MHYLVTGVDGPSFGEPDDVNGLHQDYMDGWADRMIARGPSVSPDGTLHTGSVHIIDLPDLATADRFAHDEPPADAQRKSAAILDRAGIGTTDLRASRWRRGGR